MININGWKNLLVNRRYNLHTPTICTVSFLLKNVIASNSNTEVGWVMNVHSLALTTSSQAIRKFESNSQIENYQLSCIWIINLIAGMYWGCINFNCYIWSTDCIGIPRELFDIKSPQEQSVKCCQTVHIFSSIKFIKNNLTEF